MCTKCWKQGVVLIVIMLFLGVAFAPGITASREIVETNELNSDLVEFTVMVGNRDYSILLTPDQAAELDNLIDQTKTRLDAATTMEKTAQIFDETVVSLYDLGVLPKDMSIREAQRLVKGNNRFSRLGKVLNHLSGNNLQILYDENIFCLVAGETSMTSFYPLYSRLLFHMIHNSDNFLVGYSCILLFFLLCPLVIFWKLSPVVIGNIATLGVTSGLVSGPSRGWVRTIGLSGIKNWDGKFKGTIPLLFGFGEGSCIGILGFTGISIYPNVDSSKCFYLGFARQVKLRYE